MTRSREATHYHRRRQTRTEKAKLLTEPPPYETVCTMAGPTPVCPPDHHVAAFSLDGDSTSVDVEPAMRWREARFFHLGKVRAMTFVQLHVGTDLQVPPPHYLRLDRESFIHRQAPGYIRDRDKATAAMLDAAMGVDRPSAPKGHGSDGKVRGRPATVVAAGEEALRRIIDACAFDMPLSLSVQRVGDVAVLDAGLVPVIRAGSSPQSYHQKAMYAKLLYRMAEPASHRISGLVPPPSKPRESSTSMEVATLESIRQPVRVTALATTGLANTNAGEGEHQYANTLRWQLHDADLVLGLDRPLFTDGQSLFPLVLADADALDGDASARSDFLVAWIMARLVNAPKIMVCRHRGGRVEGYDAVPTSDAQFRGSFEVLDAVVRILRWIAQSTCHVAETYRVLQVRGARELHCVTGEFSSPATSASLPWDPLLGDRDGLRRYRTATALLFLKGANHVLTRRSAPDATHCALTLMLRACTSLFASLEESYGLRQATIRQNPFQIPAARLASLLEPPEETGPILALLARLPDLCSELLEPGRTSLGTCSRVTLLWTQEFTSVCIHAAQASLQCCRDLPALFVHSRVASAEMVQAASDSVSKQYDVATQRFLCSAAAAASRVAAAAIGALRAMELESTIPAETAAMARSAIFAVGVMEATVAVSLSQPCTASSACIDAGCMTVTVTQSDEALDQRRAALSAAVREHTADLLGALLPGRRELAQLYHVATEELLRSLRSPDGWLGLPPSTEMVPGAFAGINQLHNAVVNFDTMTVGMACLRLNATSGAASRVLVKQARVHFAMGQHHHAQGRLTKALDSLALTADMLRAVTLQSEHTPPEFAQAEDSGAQLAVLRTKAQLELAKLHRTRALFERSAASNANKVANAWDAPLSPNETAAWERAINCLREEEAALANAPQAPDPQPRPGAGGRQADPGKASHAHLVSECRDAIGSSMLLLVCRSLRAHAHAVASGKAQPRPPAWYSDLLAKIDAGERFCRVDARVTLALRLRLFVAALEDCRVLTPSNIAAVLASRQHWGSSAWELCAAHPVNVADTAEALPECRLAKPIADEALREVLVVPPGEAAGVRFQLVALLWEFDLVHVGGTSQQQRLPSRAEAVGSMLACVCRMPTETLADAALRGAVNGAFLRIVRADTETEHAGWPVVVRKFLEASLAATLAEDVGNVMRTAAASSLVALAATRV
jgi:hypothetical protein